MKKWMMIAVVLFCSITGIQRATAQVTELAQLALNIEKLAQFKQILSDLKKGYEILTGGYNVIRNISEGNFSLHKVFLDGLLEVSPAVKKYKRVAGIIDYQLQLVREYKAAFARFRQDGFLLDSELDYIGRVYGQLVDKSLENLDDLLLVITAGKLRMSDEERLALIDGIYADMADKLHFLRAFNHQAEVLSLQRAKDSKETQILQDLYER